MGNFQNSFRMNRIRLIKSLHILGFDKGGKFTAAKMFGYTFQLITHFYFVFYEVGAFVKIRLCVDIVHEKDAQE